MGVIVKLEGRLKFLIRYNWILIRYPWILAKKFQKSPFGNWASVISGQKIKDFQIISGPLRPYVHISESVQQIDVTSRSHDYVTHKKYHRAILSSFQIEHFRVFRLSSSWWNLQGMSKIVPVMKMDVNRTSIKRTLRTLLSPCPEISQMKLWSLHVSLK